MLRSISRLGAGIALMALVMPVRANKPKPVGAQKDVFGNTEAFEEELKKVGQITRRHHSRDFE